MPAADPIAQLLAGTYVDPDSGTPLRAQSRVVVIEDSLAGREAELVDSVGVGRHVAVISDVATRAALGHRVERTLAGHFLVEAVELPARPRADDVTVDRLDAGIGPRVDAVIAVGSGTINDLSKMVALRRNCPHLVFATAPSMNGYTSLSASITSDGVKRSVRTKTAAGVFVDLEVLCAAPSRLIRAGLGDSVCRTTAQTDWLMAHVLLDEPYRSAPFALLEEDERALIERADGLVRGDLDAMRHLARVLVLSGFGMTICNGSYPASQGEHLLSHWLETSWPADRPPAFHGEQVGVCTIAMARLQDAMLSADRAPRVLASTRTRDELIERHGEAVGAAYWRELDRKRLTPERAERLNARLAERWDDLRARLAPIRLGHERVRAILAAAGAATTPSEIGCPPALFATALQFAHEQRDRYTFLDLAADSNGGRPPIFAHEVRE